MPKLSIIFGILLALLGAAAFYGTGAAHYTSLIPAGFGAVLLICGILGLVFPTIRMHVMHVAALIGLIGTGGGLGMSLPALLSIKPLVRPAATYAQLTMGILCAIFLALCIKSFVDARRARYPNL